VKYLNDTFSFEMKLYLLARTSTFEVSQLILLRNDIFFIQKDIRNLNEIPSDINYIIHAACSPDNIEHMSNPIETMDIISQGTKQLLESALNLSKINKIINLSSGQIYGNTNKDLISEKDFGYVDSNSIKSIYPEAKRYTETLSKAYESLYKLPIVQVRPFSFIGPMMSLEKPWAINNFLYDAIKFRKIKIIGNGKPVRSYMYPTDMVYWLFCILIHDKNSTSYNLGNSNGVSLEDIACKIKDKIGNDVKIDIMNRNDDKSIFLPDTSYIEKELTLSIKIDVDEAINETINWYTKK
jgi:dTDP-glucose 4,6-dehydratase